MTVDADKVLAWGSGRLRDLPWRRTRDPWAILAAEVMLQQTQVPRVIPKWQSFLAAYPTAADCAAATLGEVLRIWQGLGYPRRGRNLHAAAMAIVERHDGVVPDDLERLLDLPGVGPYTARAVLAFAYERDVAVVDTNIARVLARTAGERLTPRRAQTIADSWVPRDRGWEWNQILMDLGATVCQPTPRCAGCPAARRCQWHLDGHPEPDPAGGSAGVSRRQAPFAGSARQARGRIMAALADAPVTADQVDAVILASLVDDGLVEVCDGLAALPGP
jgi:A/G-specific adenine glycosylase